GHPADTLHFHGRFPYRGLSRVCGGLEHWGRTLFGFRAPQIEHPLADGQTLDFWGGIQVLHTPGHTVGHCSFYSLKHDLLFSGDLFANWLPRVMLPWPWLNSCPEKFPASIRKVLDLNPSGILANHCDKADPATQATRFQKRFASYRLQQQ
ncbi:MAG: MBL fold metallo-hydrolase, partial [Verrucomicrobiales bacterium]